MDINKVWVSGLCVSQPILTKLPSKTPFAVFNIQVNETFLDRSGVAQVKPNLLRVETLGKNAESIVGKVKQGCRYYVDGYLRQDHKDDREQVKIRTFAVYEDRADDNHLYSEGLKQALDVIRKSRDLGTAIKELENLVASR